MESAKLKNIVLTILIITNLLLLGLMVSQRLERRHLSQQALLDAAELLERQGISADPDALPKGDFPQPMTLERDSAWELERFTDLLGEDTTLTQRGLVSYYTGARGQAEVRGDGAFTVTFTPGAFPLEGSAPADHALETLERMGFTGQITDLQPEAVSAVEVWKGAPVFSCAVDAIYAAGELRSLAGTRLVGTPVADPQAAKPLSTATLLVRFRAGVIDSGDACTAILSATQGSTLSVDGAGKLRLTPVLRLETDTNLYFLDALTGALSRG